MDGHYDKEKEVFVRVVRHFFSVKELVFFDFFHAISPFFDLFS